LIAITAVRTTTRSQHIFLVGTFSLRR